jgi:hypothetical protein
MGVIGSAPGGGGTVCAAATNEQVSDPMISSAATDAFRTTYAGRDTSVGEDRGILGHTVMDLSVVAFRRLVQLEVPYHIPKLFHMPAMTGIERCTHLIETEHMRYAPAIVLCLRGYSAVSPSRPSLGVSAALSASPNHQFPAAIFAASPALQPDACGDSRSSQVHPHYVLRRRPGEGASFATACINQGFSASDQNEISRDQRAMDRDMTIYQIAPHRIVGHRSGGVL